MVLTIVFQALRSKLCDASSSAPDAVRDAQIGVISLPQRFDITLKVHYCNHALALDDFVSGDVERGVRFHEATRLEARDAVPLARTLQLRVLRMCARRGLLDSTAAVNMRTWRVSIGGSSLGVSAPEARYAPTSVCGHPLGGRCRLLTSTAWVRAVLAAFKSQSRRMCLPCQCGSYRFSNSHLGRVDGVMVA